MSRQPQEYGNPDPSGSYTRPDRTASRASNDFRQYTSGNDQNFTPPTREPQDYTQTDPAAYYSDPDARSRLSHFFPSAYIEPEDKPKRSHASSDRRSRKHSTTSNRELIRVLLEEKRDAERLHDQLQRAHDLLNLQTRRAEKAEQFAQDAKGRMRAIAQARHHAQQEAAKAVTELKLYKMQFEKAQQQLLQANEIIEQSDHERNKAEVAAERAAKLARKYRQEQLAQRARDEGRRLGREEGRRDESRYLALEEPPRITTTSRRFPIEDELDEGEQRVDREDVQDDAAQEEQAQLEEERRAIEEQRRLAEEELRMATEQRRIAEEERRAAERSRLADEERRVAEDERRRMEDMQRRAEEDRRRAEDARRAEDSRRAEDARRRDESEARRRSQELRRTAYPDDEDRPLAILPSARSRASEDYMRTIRTPTVDPSQLVSSRSVPTPGPDHVHHVPDHIIVRSPAVGDASRQPPSYASASRNSRHRSAPGYESSASDSSLDNAPYSRSRHHRSRGGLGLSGIPEGGVHDPTDPVRRSLRDSLRQAGIPTDALPRREESITPVYISPRTPMPSPEVVAAFEAQARRRNRANSIDSQATTESVFSAVQSPRISALRRNHRRYSSESSSGIPNITILPPSRPESVNTNFTSTTRPNFLSPDYVTQPLPVVPERPPSRRGERGERSREPADSTGVPIDGLPMGFVPMDLPAGFIPTGFGPPMTPTPGPAAQRSRTEPVFTSDTSRRMQSRRDSLAADGIRTGTSTGDDYFTIDHQRHPGNQFLDPASLASSALATPVIVPSVGAIPIPPSPLAADARLSGLSARSTSTYGAPPGVRSVSTAQSVYEAAPIPEGIVYPDPPRSPPSSSRGQQPPAAAAAAAAAINRNSKRGKHRRSAAE